MTNVIELFVLGRLCLFGEHSDWAGTNRTLNSNLLPGCAIVTGTQHGIYAKAHKRIQNNIRKYHSYIDSIPLRARILISSA